MISRDLSFANIIFFFFFNNCISISLHEIPGIITSHHIYNKESQRSLQRLSWMMKLYLSENFFESLGGAATSLIGSALNTAIGRDCKGRPQGDYFYGCQVPFCCKETTSTGSGYLFTVRRLLLRVPGTF